jgi:DNA (cytosine-5)-methyltransferase 1
MIDYGSVCSGIEAATVAVHPLGWKASWFAEIEPFPCAVLAHHYPDVANLGDMTQLPREILAGRVHAPGLFVGGTPCQDFSVAGMRLGLEGERGQLTIKFVETADAIDHVRTARGDDECIVWWENVPGVLSDKANAFGCFLAALVGESDALKPSGGKWTNAGCVYGPTRAAAWRVLDAQYFGLAQRRRRVFVVASARAGFDPAAVLFERDGLRRDHPPSRQPAQNVTGTIAGGARSSGGYSTDDIPLTVGTLTSHAYSGGAGGRPEGATAGHFLPATANTLLAGPPKADRGDDVNLICMAHGQPNAEISVNRAPTLTCNHEAPIVVHGTQDPCVSIDQAHTLGRNNGAENAILAFSCKDHGADAGEISPTLRAMGHGDSHANAGGQVAVCITSDITHTLKADGFDASEDGTERGQPIVASVSPTLRSGNMRNNSNPVTEAEMLVGGTAVRRLTPLECERLQGFPDNYTRIPLRLYKQRKITKNRPADMWEKVEGGWMLMAADGPRYKAIGNSKATTVVQWIARRIDAQVRMLEQSNDNNPATAAQQVG